MSTGVEARSLRLASTPAPSGLPAERANALALERELAWFDVVLKARLSLHFGQPCAHADVRQIEPPALDGDTSPYAALVREGRLGFAERLVLLLALVPHVRPQALDLLFARNANLDRGFTEFGGWKGKAHGGFLPSVETAAFLVAGDDLAQRFALGALFDEGHFFRRRGVLRLDHDAPHEPAGSAALLLGDEPLARLTRGLPHRPEFGAGFPAHRIDTVLDWSDLVLGDEVLDEVDAITTWICHAPTLMDGWRLSKAVKPGYRSLFFGPPGTGKTLTATLIGKAVGADVYRVDLSMVVSKYIGETEKNLAQVFDQAQSRAWILFFDEADALFGKRTATSSSNDRYANQEVSYLLQRVEDFPGTVILASNLKGNLDDAFARRFQSMVHFPMPDAEQRLALWRGMLVPTGRLADDVDLTALAEAHELSGGAIANVVRAAAIAALQRGREHIAMADLAKGVTKEMRKEGRTAGTP